METKVFSASDFYSALDLNRVEGNCQIIKDRIAALLGIDLTMIIKTDWSLTSIPTVEQMERIRKNIELLAKTIQMNYTIPLFDDAFDYEVANQFEKAFEFMDQFLIDMIAIIIQPMAGQYVANEPLVLPAERS